jgi:hypothetical protein
MSILGDIFSSVKSAIKSEVKSEVNKKVKSEVKKGVKKGIKTGTEQIKQAIATKETQLTFAKLPKTPEDIKANKYFSLEEPEYTAGLFLAAMMEWENDPEAAYAMVDVLRGPDPLSNFKKDFFKERLTGATYKIRAYFVGATPANDYTPYQPYKTVKIIRRNDSIMEDGGYHWAVVWLQPAGADTVRQFKCRKAKDGKWYFNDEILLADIKKAASEDPWA